MLKLINNYYDIEEEKKENIEKILNNFILSIYELDEVELTLENSIYFTMFMAEVFPMCEDKQKAEEVVYEFMKKIREGIYNGHVRSMSIFGGFAEVGLSVYLMKNSTSHYGRFLDGINEIICDFIEKNIENYKNEINNLMMQHFECIQGLSGIASYLLLFKDNRRIDSVLRLILEYMILLTENRIVNGIEVPGWHVSSKNQFRKDTKLEYPNGNFNFGLSHGIAGPLVVLSKAYINGIIVDGQIEAIKKIVNIYSEFKESDENENIYWPTLLSLEDYISKSKVARENKKASWCYGTVGIARALYFAAEALENDELKNMVINIYEKIANLKIDDYYLISPTLCHGYAGVISILNVMYRDTSNKVIKNGVVKLVDTLLGYYDKNAKYGFININPIFDSNEKGFKRDDKADFLEGGTGVMLTLLSLFKKDTIFERHLLIS